MKKNKEKTIKDEVIEIIIDTLEVEEENKDYNYYSTNN